WVTGAFFRPSADPVFVLPRMFATFDLREAPEGDTLIVNEPDDGFSVFERVVRAVAGSGVLAVGDRIWAETTLNLARILGAARLRTGSRVVNQLRRIKSAEELEAMGRAIAAVEHTMAATAPLVVPRVSRGEITDPLAPQLRLCVA